MRFPLVFGAIALGLAACAAPPASGPEPTGGTTQSIVGGSTSPDSQDATVLISDRGEPICSGTLIAPNLVLTARHCVSLWDDETECGTLVGDLPPSRFTVSTGAYADPRDSAARGVKLYVPDINELCRADIALISLDSDVPGPTAKVSFTVPNKSSSGTAVGYGGRQSREQRSGVQVLAVGPSEYAYRTRDGETIPMDPLESEIVTGESTCFGDSGGPLLDAAGRIVAVASRGSDVCRDRPVYWTTLAGHEALLRSAAEAAGHPIVDTPQGTSPPATKGPNAVSKRGDDDDDDAPSGSLRENKKAANEDEGGGDSMASSGCATSPGSPGSSAMFVAIGLALAALRRRKASRSS